MINVQELKLLLQEYNVDELSEKALSLIHSVDVNLLTVIGDRERVLFELKVHDKYVKKSGVDNFGFDKTINSLEKSEVKDIIVCNCHNPRYVLKVFLNMDYKVMGLIGVEKINKTKEEIDREMQWLNKKKDVQ